jgi:predicted nuclease of restriction endonuclease-like RecB superfamily
MNGQGGNLGFEGQDAQERDLIMEQRRPTGREIKSEIFLSLYPEKINICNKVLQTFRQRTTKDRGQLRSYIPNLMDDMVSSWRLSQTIEFLDAELIHHNHSQLAIHGVKEFDLK